jgi:hypothetical protein
MENEEAKVAPAEPAAGRGLPRAVPPMPVAAGEAAAVASGPQCELNGEKYEIGEFACDPLGQEVECQTDGAGGAHWVPTGRPC